MTVFLHPKQLKGAIYLAPLTPPFNAVIDIPPVYVNVTDAMYTAWLEDPTALRVVLFRVKVVVNGVLTTRYVSSAEYKNGVREYLANVAGGLKITQRISPDSEATLSAGDLEIYNIGGEYDSWLDDLWVNQPIQALLGDSRWVESDFRPIFNGVISAIDGSKSNDRLNIQFRNIMERLNTPMTELLIGGSEANATTVNPIALGECSNVTLPLSNKATLEYIWGYPGDNEGMRELRTDGKPRTSFNSNSSTGRLIFTEAVGTGQVTAVVQGLKLNGVYVNDCANLVKLIVTTLGLPANRFSLAEIDIANFNQFAVDHPQGMGEWVTDRTNVINVIKDLTSSIGAQLVPSSLGLLQLIQFNIPTTATTEIQANQQLDNTIKILNHYEVAAAVNLGYDHNYTVENNLQTTLPVDHLALYAQEYAVINVQDSVVKAAYKLDAAPDQENTCLKSTVDATAEANRRLNFRKVPRRTYGFEGTPSNTQLQLGQAVKLFSNRYNLKAGKVGIVSGLTTDFGNLHVTVEVTV